APPVSGVADAATPGTGRRRAGPGRRYSCRRQEFAAVQAPGLRPPDRAGRRGRPGVGAARVVVPDFRHPAPGPHRRRAEESDRRRNSEAAARRADAARTRAVGQPDRSVVLQPDGACRGLRRHRRPVERVLHRNRRPRLVQRGPEPLSRDFDVRCPCCRRSVPAARSPRRTDPRAGEEAMTARIRCSAACAAALIAVATVGAQQAPDRSHPPQPGPPPALHLPAIQKRQLANGLPVWIVELHEVPVVQVNLVVLSGSADDPPRRFGIANMTASMLEEGAGSRSTLEIADAVDYLGADLTTTSGIDSSVVRLHVPVARLADAMPIMADVALRPTFPKDELERMRQQRLTAILQARDNPATIAAIGFSRVLYGTTHRYGTPMAGTAETIKTFEPDDLKAFYASAYRPNNAALLEVGDITAEKVMPLLESSF